MVAAVCSWHEHHARTTAAIGRRLRGRDRGVLGNAPGSGIAGGRSYEEIIGACCLRGRATTLLTFNLEHFESFRARGLDVVVPAD
jgi:hypothetical protein